MKVRFASVPVLLACLAWNQGAVAQVIVAESMRMNDQESAAFWPVYHEYCLEVARINDRFVTVITDHAAQRDTLFEPMVKVGRFYQIENKLDAITRLEMVAHIPLAR